MSRKYKIRDQSALHFVTFTVIHWLDVFIRREYGDVFLDSIRYCQANKGLEVCAYCIMSSHIYLIIGIPIQQCNKLCKPARPPFTTFRLKMKLKTAMKSLSLENQF